MYLASYENIVWVLMIVNGNVLNDVTNNKYLRITLQPILLASRRATYNWHLNIACLVQINYTPRANRALRITD